MALNTVFFYPNASRYIGISLGVASLGAIINEAGHHCRLFDATFLSDAVLKEEFVEFIETSNCAVIFVHCTSSDWWLVRHMLNYLDLHMGKRRPLTVVGGQHPTIQPELVAVESGIDLAVMGEGEIVIREILDRISNGRSLLDIPNTCVEHNGAIIRNNLGNLFRDLDSLPFPRWDYFDPKHRCQYDVNGTSTGVMPLNIETSRGCPYACSFCINSYYQKIYRGKGRFCREKSARRVVAEAAYAKESMGVNFLQIIDDNFLNYRDRLDELSQTYPVEVGLPFSVQASADKIDENSLALLKKMGVSMLALGIESGNENLRSKILNKKVTDKQIIHATELAKKHGVAIMAYYMLGLPTESEEDVEKTIKFNQIIQPDISIVSCFYPFPGTRLYSDFKLETNNDFGPDFFHVGKASNGFMTDARFQEYKNRFGRVVTNFGPLAPRSAIN